jgi:cold shock CspA family protein
VRTINAPAAPYGTVRICLDQPSYSMPEGHITAYDTDTTSGHIASDDSDDTFAFERSDVVDRRTGEQLRTGQTVTFEVDGERATNIHRVTPRGYGA